MKMTQYLLIVLMAGALAVAGCGKSNKQAATATQHTPGVVDLNGLQAAFPDAPTEVRTALDQVRFNTRYGFHEKSLAALDTLNAMPNLTDAQKKAVADVIEQVKAAIAAKPAPSQ